MKRWSLAFSPNKQHRAERKESGGAEKNGEDAAKRPKITPFVRFFASEGQTQPVKRENSLVND